MEAKEYLESKDFNALRIMHQMHGHGSIRLDQLLESYHQAKSKEEAEEIREQDMEQARAKAWKNNTWVDSASFRLGFRNCWEWITNKATFGKEEG